MTDAEERVVRGGSGDTDDPADFRGACRLDSPPEDRLNDLGLRPARDAEEDTHALRGGSWLGNAPGRLRCIYRSYDHPMEWADTMGFRPARDAQKPLGEEARDEDRAQQAGEAGVVGDE